MNKRVFLIIIFVFFLSLGARLLNLGSFMTADEQTWMLRSGEFWHKLFRDADPKGTFVTTHPGTSVMWLAGAGIVAREYQLGYDIDTFNIRDFRFFALIPLVVVSSVLIALATYYSLQIFGVWAGVFAGALLSLDPYLVGMNKIVHVDGLLSLFMVNAALLMMLVGRIGNDKRSVRIRSLFILGLMTGLALSTKMLPALWLFVSYGVYMLASLIAKRIYWQQALRRFGFVVGTSSLVVVLLWPAMWSKTDNLDQYIAHDTQSVITDEHVSVEASEIPPAFFYARTVIGRTAPFVLIVTIGVGVVCSLVILRHICLACVQSSLMVRMRNVLLTIPVAKKLTPHPVELLWFFFWAVGFLVLITFIAKKADRYALPSLVMFLVIAGYGVGYAMKILRPRLRLAVCTLIIAALSAELYTWMPYEIAYDNPLFSIRILSQQGWGEGLDAAARVLNKSPFIDRLTIASWYPSVTSSYFNGRTMSLSSREDHRVGYVVLYRNMGGRQRDSIASDVIDEFRGRAPEHVITIQGTPYAWIYNTLGPWYFRQNTGELLPGMEVGQLVPVSIGEFSRIDIALATYGHLNEGTVTLHVRDRISSLHDIRSVTLPARRISDQEWQAFTFDPILNSKGKEYYVALTAEDSLEGKAITVRYTDQDVLPGQALIRRAVVQDGINNEQYLKEGDIAWRIPK